MATAIGGKEGERGDTQSITQTNKEQCKK